MRILKIILSFLGIVLALALISALFVKKEYEVEKEIIINKPKEEVFEYLKFLKNQDNFSKWASLDPNMKKSYSGTDGTVGFVSRWESENQDVGHGEQEIKKIIPGERIEYELRFIKPFQATEPAFLSTESLGENQTKVIWGFKGHMDYPFNLWLIFMDFEKMIGDDLQTGLLKLKTLLEKP
ncbi:MAG: polyketide cyclase [Flavobacteriaceae bacterium]|nr:MAG: polyketide cyclase [Flavobacteriaceae bacterium]